MNTYELSRNEIQSKYGQCENLKDLVSEIESLLWSKKHVLCQLNVNGHWLDEVKEKKLSLTPVHEIDNVECVVKPLKNLVQENLLALMDWVESAKVAMNQSIECIDLGKIDEFNALSISLFEGLQWFVDSLTLIKNPLGQVIVFVDDKDWQSLQDEFALIMKEFVLVFESKDYSASADLLDMKLSENLQKWLVLLQKQDKIMNS